MKHETKVTMYFLAIILITLLLAILLAPYAVIEKLDVANNNPFAVIAIFVISVAIGSFVFTRLHKQMNKVWLDAIMIFAFSHAVVIFTTMFFVTKNWINSIIYVVFYVILYWGLLKSMQRDDENMLWAAHIWNAIMIVVFLGIGIKLGYILPVWTSMVLLMVAAVYDYWAVFKSKHMVVMAKFFKERRLFPGFMLRKSNGEIAVLGGGDVFFMVLMVVACLKISYMFAIAGAIGMFIGISALYFMSQKKKFYPALPPIAFGLFAGVLVAIIGGW
jgi:presenilin-like A22 family membrane protease